MHIFFCFGRKTFVSPEDVVAQRVSRNLNLILIFYVSCFLLLNFGAFLQIVTQKDSPRGVHFRRAGPREKVCSLFEAPLHVLFERLYKNLIKNISDIRYISSQKTCVLAL